ncbi:hypothetical protein GCM10010421_05220 [Streptomyces glaucus]|uniref:Secreted protein n=1 Tax=Streptomyces glaucus TaxID=284029 RepID=A0ABP5W8B0_9ACTN
MCPLVRATTRTGRGVRVAAPLRLTRMHRVLIGVVVAGAVVIAGIGFAGSYAAVRERALKKGFEDFSYAFPVGIDAGIRVLPALDLLPTEIRIPLSPAAPDGLAADGRAQQRRWTLRRTCSPA